ncbi:MAG: pseudouridine synthase [Selenomonadales bacterium]|nr:rRNA pseudouridine synthase [Selenomonadales bacterium]MDD7763813.1 pseudouridine synthase [Selenomonadales bacterium]
MAERLQKLISQAGLASRRAAEKMILAGKVIVDGKVITELGQKFSLTENVIIVDGKKINAKEDHVYYLINKPKGYLSTAKDERGRRTVLDLLPDVSKRVYPVGRLDNNTEGLLLITNDGALMNGLLHPKFEVEKTYIAKVTGIPSGKLLARLRDGIMLSDGMTAPAKVELLAVDNDDNESRIAITIHEGRNRQVRRMFQAIGSEVKALKRVKFAQLDLTGVRRGGHRALTQKEIEALYKLAGLKQ